MSIRPQDWSIRKSSSFLGALAGLLVLFTIAAPGITIDEPLDVRPGRDYVKALMASGPRFFSREVSDKVYSDNREHPPLGRWMLGIASTLAEPFEVMLTGGADPIGIYVLAGRVAPTLIFALLVAFISSEAGRRHGKAACWSTGFALIVMPRLFSHAHLGALDLFIAAAWCLALIKADRALMSDRPIRGMAIAGVFFGLAMLVKIHGWLLPPIVLANALWRLGFKRAIVAMTVWTSIGLAVFFVGWPWLWFDTLNRLQTYLGTGVERVAIYVQYFGQVYRDKDVPWHFPWVYFATTVPVGLHAIGIVGGVRAFRERDARTIYLITTIAVILAFFSTNVPVYDGERLYLLVFPLWAIVIGKGFSTLWTRVSNLSRGLKLATTTAKASTDPKTATEPLDRPNLATTRVATPWFRRGLLVFLISQSLGLLLIFPYGLSYYNLLVGGLPGAERLGLEVMYWSESVDPGLLYQLASVAPEAAKASLAPTLAPEQGKVVTGRDLINRRIVLGDDSDVATSDFIVVYRRPSYWKDDLKRVVEQGEGTVVATRSRQGVWLSRIYRRVKR
jgi:4-amino-4-deoxy-L-arabinose transferase-like glycosyltransferase